MGLPSAGLRTTQNILAAELHFNEILIIRRESFSLFTFTIIIRGTLKPPFSRAISRFIGKFGMKQEFDYITPRSLIT